MKKILTVVGTRPNIIKITQFKKVAATYDNIDYKLLHTGQHYSDDMNDVFFNELSLDLPDFSMEPNRATVLTQIADIMVKMEEVVTEYKPDIMVVVGDVNSTLAASLVANKLNIKLVHVESGLRSFDRSMPEEHNRMVTDSVSDAYFVTEKSGLENLAKEGKPDEAIHFVGNTMIDTLVAYDAEIRASNVLQKLSIEAGSYGLMTMHRPGNVDEKTGLQQLLDVVTELTKLKKIVFPMHPRTKKMFEQYGLADELTNNPNLTLLGPVGYLDFQNLILNSAFVITDSGGIQEETTFRQIPCITLRPNTERPITLEIGSNTLMDFDPPKIIAKVNEILSGSYKSCKVPELWDGKSTERIFEVLSTL